MILAISGKARSGKDLLAKIAAPYGFKRLAFADDLKQRVRNDFSLTEAHTDGALKEEPTAFKRLVYDPGDTHYAFWTPREIMIEYGRFYRQFDPMFWVSQVIKKIQESPSVNYIITDCRFPNEIEALKNIGAVTIRLERHPDRDKDVSDSTKANESELALDNYKEWDFKLEAEANKNPDDLKRLFSLVLDQIGRKI